MDYFKRWCKATGMRTLKTMAETALGLLGSDLIGILEVDWLSILSTCAFAAVITILTCIKGLPELKV